MKTLIISAITCLLMASCNEVGRYQYAEIGAVLDTQEGIKYSSRNWDRTKTRTNVVTGEEAELTKGDDSKYYWKITQEGTTEERVELPKD